MDTRDTEQLGARVARLERLLCLVVVGWIVSVAIVCNFFGSSRPAIAEPETLTLRELRIVDRAGTVRMRLTTWPDEELIRKAGGDSRDLRDVAQGTVSSVLELKDRQGTTKFNLAVDAGGDSRLGMSGPKGTALVYLWLRRDGTPFFHLVDSNSTKSFFAP